MTSSEGRYDDNTTRLWKPKKSNLAALRVCPYHPAMYVIRLVTQQYWHPLSTLRKMGKCTTITRGCRLEKLLVHLRNFMVKFQNFQKISKISKIKLIKLNFVHPGKGVDNPSDHFYFLVDDERNYLW